MTSPGFASPQTDTMAPSQGDIFDSDSYSQDEVDDSPVTIGPAAAAAAAAAEAASAQAFADAELAGMVAGRSPGGPGGSGAAARSRADEHDAKLLLFGRQLGGGLGGAGGGGASGISASAGGTTGKSLLSIGLPQGIKRLAFSGKKGGGGGGSSTAGGTLKRAGEAEGKIS